MAADPARVPKRPREDGTDAAPDAPPLNPLTTVAEADHFLVLLQSYYKNFYPFQLIFDWLSYGDAAAMRSREISYTKEPEIYVRYKAFQTAEEFRTDCTQFVPNKIDIGGHYNKPPSAGNSGAYVLDKELVFDIDMDDYNSVKGCGCTAKAQICKRCWRFMSIAVEVVDRILRNDFGFQCIGWVFSGRRGMHCWVSDPEARKLGNEARQAITDYMGVLEQKTGKVTKLRLPLHPSLKHIYDKILVPRFEQYIIPEHGLFDSEESGNKVLDMLPQGLDDVKQRVRQTWAKEKHQPPLWKWQLLCNTVKAEFEKKDNKKALKMKVPVIEEIVFTFTWPRLDANVSKDNKHLLKAPFCIHPSTQRVCVPVNPEHINEFDFEKVPRVMGVIEQPASMEPYVQQFKTFLERTLQVTKKEKEKEKKDSDPSPMDW